LSAEPLELSPEGWPYASSAAGRFHCLFGRDSLITALQLLPVRPEIAEATVDALAARQGVRDDPFTGEQPGKIGHEFRAEPPPSFVGWPPGPFAYYGTADASCWFVIVARALGRDDHAVRAAAAWLARALDDGDGLVRHMPTGALAQQGWRDTIDAAADANGGGFVRADGTNPAPPLADIDTQAVALAALRALSWTDRADALEARLLALPVDTMAIEAGGALVPGAGSQLGWLLWAGVQSDAIADRLCAPDVLTDFGLRTLSREDPNFRPDAYHRGSVWPFDSWLGWGGLRRAGRPAEAERVRTGVLAALERLGSPHELYAVSDAGVSVVASSNAVQAWSIGARWALEHEFDGICPQSPLS
jgi:glycogen debranching enzyme